MTYIEFSSTAFFTDEVKDHITIIEGIIKNYEGKKIGEVEAYYLDIAMSINQNYDTFELFDAIIDLNDYYTVLYDASDVWFRETVIDELGGDVRGTNLLIIHRIEILPEHRGQKVGLAAIYKTAQQFGHGCGFIALTPAPLQFQLYKDDAGWQNKMNISDFVRDKETATNKLGAYYGKLGFRQVGDSDIYVLNPAHKQPDLTTIGFE